MVDVLVICGAAGVGKSFVSWEIGRLLERADVPHAIIDSDELDRVHPTPQPLSALVAISRTNLAALWRTFAALGHTRLVICGVFVDLDAARSWIADAVGPSRIFMARLVATDDTLRRRVETREIGSGRDDQLRRTMAQARAIRDQRGVGAATIDTDDRRPEDVAREILESVEWVSVAIRRATTPESHPIE